MSQIKITKGEYYEWYARHIQGKTFGASDDSEKDSMGSQGNGGLTLPHSGSFAHIYGLAETTTRLLLLYQIMTEGEETGRVCTIN